MGTSGGEVKEMAGMADLGSKKSINVQKARKYPKRLNEFLMMSWSLVRMDWRKQRTITNAKEIVVRNPEDLLLYYYHAVVLSHHRSRLLLQLHLVIHVLYTRASEVINHKVSSKHALHWYQMLQSCQADLHLDHQQVLCRNSWWKMACTCHKSEQYGDIFLVRASINDGLLHTRVSTRVG